MVLKLCCDNCGKKLGTYLYGPGGIEEKAVITFANKSTVPIYGKYNHIIGRKVVTFGLPDLTCFKCIDNWCPSDLAIV